MLTMQQVNQIFHKVTADSVRCGALTIFAVAQALFIGVM
ncbi:hypothetical protein AM1_B0021 (plasmid) [Acaryochloris marina MBIC11017]|uniref:Uncharacterized protein n=1 Tax=Acaryochloris marina (strain MBIC 11017) TaxID=329726 RepID=A8ZLX8_ACAM1|nr:hypothetical protein AM1_B0021 [Acaryochloris marina MBIC11017]